MSISDYYKKDYYKYWKAECLLQEKNSQRLQQTAKVKQNIT